MNRIGILLAVVVVVSGAATAQPEVDNVDMISGEEYQLTFDVPSGESYTTTLVDGAVTRQSVSASDDTVTVTVVAETVSSESTANVLVQFTGSETQTQISVYPTPTQQNNQAENIENAQQKAERYEELMDQWVQQRVRRQQTEDGTLVVYEQIDPTRGDIDPQTGLPEGEWVQIDVNNSTGEPQWLFETPRGALVYTTRHAYIRYGERTMWVTGSALFSVAVVIFFTIVLPWRRRRKEQQLFFGGSD